MTVARPLFALEVESPRSAPRDGSVRLRNWCNMAAFLLSTAISYSSLSGAYGLTNAEVSAKYQTLVTPARWTFSIWSIIFFGEGVAMFAQLLPRYRDCDLVVRSSFWWQATCFWQLLWTATFTREALLWSAFCMLGILASLVFLAMRVDAIDSSLDAYLLLKAPFSLHMSWVACTSAVNANILADASGLAPSTLLAVAIVSLVLISCFVTIFALAMEQPDPVVPFVVALALGGVGRELTDAAGLESSERFNPYLWPREVLMGVRSSAVILNGASGLAFIAAVAILARKTFVASRRKA